MKALDHIIRSLIIACTFLCACTEDPSPEAFLPPEMGEVTATVKDDGVLLRCLVGETGRISECGFSFGVKGENPDLYKASCRDGAFEYLMTGLESGVRYRYRAYISGGHSTVYSDPQEFIIEQEYPSIAQIAIDSIGRGAVSIRYDIAEAFSGGLWSCGLCWSESPGPDIESGNKSIASHNGYGIHSDLITGLETGKEYHVRAYAVNSRGVSYSGEVVFSMPVWCDDVLLHKHLLETADNDGDGYISVAEAGSVRSMRIVSDGISSLKGIEWCKNLEVFALEGSTDEDGKGNGLLATADFSGNPMLEEITVSGQSLESVSLGGCSGLRIIDLSRNRLTSIDLSGAMRADSIDLSYNRLTAADLSACTALKRLDISGNDIYAPVLPETGSIEDLGCSQTKITDLNAIFRRQRNIRRLDARGMLTDGTHLEILTKLERLDCSGSQTSELTVKYNDRLSSLRADDCRFHTLDINRNGMLSELYCVSSRLDTLYLMEGHLIDGINRNMDGERHIADNTLLVYSARVTDEAFNSYLTANFDNDGDGIVSAPEARNVQDMRIDSSVWTGIESLHGIEMFASLRTLDVSGQKLTALDMSANKEIETLIVDNNPLLSLELSSNKGLRYLYCQSVPSLHSIDLSCNTLLREAYFLFSGLAGTLDLRKCSTLGRLDVRGTSLSQVIVPDGIYINISAPDGTEIVTAK